MYKLGETVIVTEKNKKEKTSVNRVGVIMSFKTLKKVIFYDVLMETRSVNTLLNTSPTNRIYINRTLTANLCEEGHVIANIPYKQLVEDEALPIICA